MLLFTHITCYPIWDPCIIGMRSTGGIEKGGLNRGPLSTSLIFNQLTSELLDCVLHLTN